MNNVINDELDSDEEVCFEKKIKPKNMITSDLIKGIPTINLSQRATKNYDKNFRRTFFDYL